MNISYKKITIPFFCIFMQKVASFQPATFYFSFYIFFYKYACTFSKVGKASIAPRPSVFKAPQTLPNLNA
jgi:hypothetical protein